MRRMIGRELSILGFLAVLLAGGPAIAAPDLRIIEAGAEGIELELALPAPELVAVELDGRDYTELRLPGYACEDRSGYPALPFVARLLAVPPGARVEVEIQEANFIELQEIDLAPVPEYEEEDPERPLYNPDPAAYAASAFLPEKRVTVEYAGLLRGVSAHALRLYPFSYDAAGRKLRVYTRLRVRLRFEGGRRPRPARLETTADGDLYGAFLNGAQAPLWSAPPPAAKILADGWYDPALPWIKAYVTEDGLFRIDPAWLSRYGAPEGIDPRTFRLFYRGEEQALDVKGQEDGRFDAEDYLIFYGRFRRDDREFGSLYGKRNVYWLTWSGEEGRRFVERSGTPVNNFPQARSFRSTAHFEVDINYDPLPDAPDADGDHWFWDQPVKATKPDIPSSRSYAGSLVAPDLETEESARLHVALHGSSNLPHHTVTKLNNLYTVSDTIWGARRAGQVELHFESEIPHSYLRDGTNRLLLQVFADQEKFDLVYLNWFALEYRRLYEAKEGYLEFGRFSAEEQRITVSGLRNTDIELYDVANGIRFSELQIASAGGGIEVTFEDASPPSALYAMADRTALKTPRGQLDEPSSWRYPANGADYLIIAHPSLLGEGKKLADHRRTQGLQVELISAEDLYDEFSHGLFDRQGIAAFIRYAYDHWDRRPAYVLLLGDDTYDYRGILGSKVILPVPTLYYQSRSRGRAPSDYLYSLVDGDDLLPDLAIGRLVASVRGEARQIVDKIIDYDLEPEPGDWRSRAIYLANYHDKDIFTAPSDSLAARYTEPLGLTSVKVYSPDESPFPNAVGREFLEALNDGALLLNFNGHGSAAVMQFIFAADQPDWDYLSQVRNGRRLPLVLAFSCLNGLFVNPKVEGLAELFTNRAEGGAIAYVSATAKSFVAQNDLLADLLYQQLFGGESPAFGPVLNSAKAQVLAAHSSYLDVPLTMQLFGDPAQKLALLREPDYVAEDLQVTADPLFSHATVQVRATLRNIGRLMTDSLEVVVLGRGENAALSETLFVETRPSFAGTEEISFPWQTRTRRGSYDLELILDADDRAAELDEGNNNLQRQLEILAPLRAEPIFPAPSAVVSPEALRLEAIAPLEDDFACEFILSSDPDFAPDDSFTSSPVNAQEGKATFIPEGIAAGQPFFWKVRLLGNRGTSAWSASRSFAVASDDSSTWQQRGSQLLTDAGQGIALTQEGLVLSPERPPFRPNTATRDSGFTVRGLDGVGVLTMDGRYVYAKRWYNDDSTIYEGIDFFTRVGTGFSGTFRTGHFGILADSTTAGISATWHSDGYIYSENGKEFQLERIVPATGKLDIVAVPDGLLEWKTGPEWKAQKGINNHALITSDGQYIYNASMSSEKGMRAEWSFRVFDPAAEWALVREFTSPPTENGFTYKWTDGLVADGQRLYLIEYGGQRRIRMIDAFDGHFLDEWTSDQDITRAITGQYDWLNDKIWLGDLRGSAIFQYSRLPGIESAAVLSETIGPAAAWRELRLEGEGDLTIDLLVEAEDDWVPHPEFTGLLPGERVRLDGLDADSYPRIRLRAVLKGEPQTAVLHSWSVDFTPLPSLRMARAEGRRQGAELQVELQVRNLSAFAVEGAQVLLERSDRTEPLLARELPSLVPGATGRVLLDSLEIPPEGVRLFARVQAPLTDAQPEDDRREIPLLFGGRAPMSFAVWPERVVFLSGDPLRSDQSLIIAAPGVPGSQLELAVDGITVDADSTLDSLPEDGPRILYRPQLTPGDHRLQVRLLRGGEELGLRELRFRLDAGLVVANPLIYPHPVRQGTAFTCVLSLDAEVEVEIYSLSGRLIRRLGPALQTAGFGMLEWDGRDADGRRLANGTYLYLLRARSGDREVVFRGPLAVVR
jgi:hypothetical protein